MGPKQELGRGLRNKGIGSKNLNKRFVRKLLSKIRRPMVAAPAIFKIF